jgi:hypothetical protein
MNSSNRLPTIVVLGAIMIFAALALTRIAAPFSVDDITHVEQARQIAAHQPISYRHSPQLYTTMLATIVKIFGPIEALMRLPGIIGVFMVFFMIGTITKMVYPSVSKKTIALIIMLYALHPAVTQGALMLDIDNTILPVIFLFLLATIITFEGKFYQWLTIVLLTTVFFFAKLLAPILFALVLFPYLYLHRKSLKYGNAIITAYITGFGLFFALWALLTGNSNQTYQPFEYLFSHIITNPLASVTDLGVLFSNFTHFTLWSNIYLLILTAITFAVKNENPKSAYLKIGIVSILINLFIVPINFGFPKYYIPAISMTLIAAGPIIEKIMSSISNTNNRKLIFYGIIGCGLLYFCGDPIYALRFSVRKILSILTPPETILIIVSIFMKWSLIFILFYWIMFLLAQKNKAPQPKLTALIICIFSSLAALTIRQNNAPYETGCSYAEKGTVEVIDKILPTCTRDTMLIAPSNISYYCNIPTQLHDLDVLRNPENILNIIKPRYDVIIVNSLPSSPYMIYKSMNTYKPFKDYINDNFFTKRIGTYTVYTKRKPYKSDCPAK